MGPTVTQPLHARFNAFEAGSRLATEVDPLFIFHFFAAWLHAHMVVHLNASGPTRCTRRAFA